MQPSRRFTRKADDLPWSVLAHASSVVTRGRLQSGSHGLRWRAREGSFGIPGPCWPGAVLSIADPAGQRSHLRVYGRPARAALTAGGSLTPANAPQWPQEPLSRDTEGVKVSWFLYHPPDLRRAVGFLKFPLRRVPASSRYRPYRATVDPSTSLGVILEGVKHTTERSWRSVVWNGRACTVAVLGSGRSRRML